MARREAGLVAQRPLRGCIPQAKAKGDYQARVHSDKMVLVVVRWEAGLVAWWPKTLK
jgi:hypothetical protein